MRWNGYTLSLLFLFFIGLGIAARMLLMKHFGGATDMQFQPQDLACVFNLC